MKKGKIKLSVVVPVYNEEKSVVETIHELIKTLRTCDEVAKFELIAVDDGSFDKSSSELKKIKREEFSFLGNKVNRGYGFSLKRGISVAKFEWILIIDADGTYPIKDVPKLIRVVASGETDMVIGARIKKGVKIEPIRVLPKKMVVWLAELLTRKKIDDINSGMRIFRKSLAREFWHLFPDKFSFTTTITMASLLSGYNVEFVPIDYYKRVGKSSIKSIDFFYFLGVIVRLVVYFKPLNFFFFPGLLFFLFSFCYMVYTATMFNNITDTGLLLLFFGMQFMFFGLIADLLVKNRNSNNDGHFIN